MSSTKRVSKIIVRSFFPAEKAKEVISNIKMVENIGFGALLSARNLAFEEDSNYKIVTKYQVVDGLLEIVSSVSNAAGREDHFIQINYNTPTRSDDAVILQSVLEFNNRSKWDALYINSESIFKGVTSIEAFVPKTAEICGQLCTAIMLQYDLIDSSAKLNC